MVKTITVCLAAYKGAPWLREQLRSLRGQDDPALTVLMQDDGSNDETVSLLLEAAAQDSRFRMARESGRHFGAAGNFLSLMRQADTEYVALCDQDDSWEPNRLSLCRRAMEEAEAASSAAMPILVHSDCKVIAENGTLLHESFFAHQGWDSQANTLNRLLVQNNVTGCTTLLNRPLLDIVCAHGDAKQMFMHDWFMAQTAAAFGRVVFVKAPLVRYRQHGTNAIGASEGNLLQRGLQALNLQEKAQKRLQLNYQQARCLYAAYKDVFPAEAKQIVENFLATEQEPKHLRTLHLLQGGYTMQNPVTVAGQIFFG